MKPMNIYICGVGGQGIGLLSDVIARACIKAGYAVRGCDTHGLAQRGGTVVSHLRIGEELFGPRVPPGKADLVVALERLEALRAARRMLRPGGTVLYYDTEYQPICVRTFEAGYPSVEELEVAAAERRARLERVFVEDLPDPRMQNAALLGRLAGIKAIGGVTLEILVEALEEAVPRKIFEPNRAVLTQAAVAE